MMLRTSRHGFVPDWIIYDVAADFLPDRKYAARGGYDAIRVYLWAGMLHEDEPYRPLLLNLLRPMAERVKLAGKPPRTVDTESGVPKDFGPAGFSAALMPLLKSLHYVQALADARKHVAEVFDHPDYYYDQVLALFALGWMEGRYRFGPSGQLQPEWNKSCTEDSKQP